MKATVDRREEPRQPSCDDCPLVTSRRAFLRDVGLAAAAALAAVSLVSPATALAQTISEIEPVGARLLERTYTVPVGDSVSVDVGNDVIIARWQNRVYAFSLRCPHKGTRLEWRQSEERVYCPKHKARFTANGSHVSGRGSRDLDRYAIRSDGQRIIVSLGHAFRSDAEPAAWAKAVVSL